MRLNIGKTGVQNAMRYAINWAALQAAVRHEAGREKAKAFLKEIDVVQGYYLRTFIRLVEEGEFETAFQAAFKTMKVKVLEDFHRVMVDWPMATVATM